MEELEAGIYTWLVATDLQYGDSLVATLFGLNPHDTRRGLPLAKYIERIHQDDRAEVSRLIDIAINDGQSFYAEYRVVGFDSLIQEVIDVGRCYYHSDGTPHVFSGIVYPISRFEIFEAA